MKMKTGIRNAGEFCWINMLTPQPAQAMAFFGQLLRWTFVEMQGVAGHAIQVGGHDVGGLFDLDSPTTPPGCSAMIGVVIKVENADSTVEKAIALGGSARPAFDIMDFGRMAVLTDPNGAEFDVWQSRKMKGTEADSALHGAPCWFETLTTDPDRARAFYTDLMGWTTATMPAPDGEYTSFKLGEEFVAGMMRLPPHIAHLKPFWTTYFTVEDADETARQAASLGAKICVPPCDIPNVGRFCVMTSPQGVGFSVIRHTW